MKPLPVSLFLPALSLMAHAVDHRRPNGMVLDCTAHQWFESLSAAYGEMPDPHIELINGIVTRSMIIDYAVLDYVNHFKPRQLAVTDCGCGFSTRYYRLGLESRVKIWVHMDLAEVIAVRRGFQGLAKHELMIESDLTDANKTTFIVDPHTLVIAEGLLNHLPYAAAKALLEEFRGKTMIGTLMHESALQKIKNNVEGLGTIFPVWGLNDACTLESFLEPALLERTWLLGKVARMIGLVRPERDDEASGIVFLAQL